MFDGTYALLMAEYNQWMNGKLYAGCARLSDEERKRDRGAFFKSIHGTLNHLVWGDRGWLPRFNGKSYPTGPVGVDLYDDFGALTAARAEMDEEILTWARGVTPRMAGRADDLDQPHVRVHADAPALGAGRADVQPPDAPPRAGARACSPPPASTSGRPTCRCCRC